MCIFNRIFVVFFLAVLTLSGGAAEVRRTLLAEDATQGWELPANVRMAGSEFMIPAGSGGEVLSPRFSLPKPRQEMMIGFEFRTSPEFEPGNWKMYVEVVWLDASGRVLGRHHQHPWFVFPAPALNGKWLPFHRPVTAECAPENAVAARLRFSCSGKGGKGSLTVRKVTFDSFYRLRGGSFANWFEPGEPIVFRGTLPPDVERIRGVVTASDGTAVAERTVARKEFEQNGWSCRLTRPGFYAVRFFYEKASGESVPVVQEYYAQRINGNRLVEERKFERDFPRRKTTVQKQGTIRFLNIYIFSFNRFLKKRETAIIFFTARARGVQNNDKTLSGRGSPFGVEHGVLPERLGGKKYKNCTIFLGKRPRAVRDLSLAPLLLRSETLRRSMVPFPQCSRYDL